ncbi:ac108 [Sucra jujuba nucleopolyhedrovirus]|uniref:Ac108 n=1 Tax=Sucra jujuba nucleopolyhedrovirus TaxID=1563660 RepID=A0A097P951_9ABAC|nr:ac108 [Sucra jujuba nucleopolyhedrovirus]AIU41329.1 ac108 [Sucra jujuba nucleopolyhedrovirus]
MRRTATVSPVVNKSILDYDQLQQLVSKNTSFLRDFFLVICAILIFIIIMVFILFILAIGKNTEQEDIAKIKQQHQFLSNLDYRYI